MKNPGDILVWLNTALKTHSVTYGYSVIEDAIEEIERLRAVQFSWVPYDQNSPCLPGAVFVRWSDGCYTVGLVPRNCLPQVTATHWALIPPLPEKSQDEKDEEIWRKYLKGYDYNKPPGNALPNQVAYRAFLAGLRAAREPQ